MAENKDSRWSKLLIKYLHDPVDKPWEIQGHEGRAQNYAEMLNITFGDKKDYQGADVIASTIERKILPPKITQEFNEIKHPFSDDSSDGVPAEFDEVEKIVKNVFDSLEKELNNKDEKAKFLYLWRNLLPLLIEKTDNEELRKKWGIIPADTRVPDHSLWEHLKITSAIEGYYDDKNKNLYINNSLFLLSIGPVQSFISNARKLSDFWAGSFILSYLIFEGMKVIIDRYGPTSIIYPELYEQPLMDDYLEKQDIEVKNSVSKYFDMPTIPNRFVALLPIYKKDEIKNLGKEIENKIKDSWIKIGEEVIKKKLGVKKIINNDVEIDIDAGWEFIENQLKTFPEIYWVALPFRKDSKTKLEYIGYEEVIDYIYSNEDAENIERQWKDYEEFIKVNSEHKSFSIGNYYSLLYTMLEKMMGARKNLRNFEQLKETGKKCSVCGEYNGIIKRGNVREDHKLRIKEHEQLCAICAVKRGLRLADKITRKDIKEQSFPTTEEVCFGNYRDEVMDTKEWKEYEELFKKYDKNGRLFESYKFLLPKLANKVDKNKKFLIPSVVYEHNLNEDFLKEYGIKNEEEIKVIRERYGALKEKYGAPQSYYAVIKLDGDRMGKWLSGENMPNIKSAYNSKVWKDKLSEDFKNNLYNNIPLNERKDNNNSNNENDREKVKKMLSPALHSSISTALRNYAIEFVRKIVEEEHLGKLIYAGGDDVLALVNLKDLFPVMRKLRFAFSGQIKFNNKGEIEVDIENKSGFVEKDGVLYLTMGKNATASMGVVIAHYKTPLRMVINKVNEMEKKAKDNNRNSFAIAWIKHSGETVEYVSKYFNKKGEEILETLENIRNLFDEKEEKYLSKSLIYKITNFINEIYSKEDRKSLNENLLKIEIQRLIDRSIIKNPNYEGDKEITKENLLEATIKYITNIPKKHIYDALQILKAFVEERR